jgi:uncharacterized membrane protein
MSKHSSMLQLAISGVLALSGAALTSTALAADDDGKEQCAGIVKAAKNDCATSANDCHGHVNTDGNAEAWIYLPMGTCERIVGGRVVHVKEPPPKTGLRDSENRRDPATVVISELESPT